MPNRKMSAGTNAALLLCYQYEVPVLYTVGQRIFFVSICIYTPLSLIDPIPFPDVRDRCPILSAEINKSSTNEHQRASQLPMDTTKNDANLLYDNPTALFFPSLLFVWGVDAVTAVCTVLARVTRGCVIKTNMSFSRAFSLKIMPLKKKKHEEALDLLGKSGQRVTNYFEVQKGNSMWRCSLTSTAIILLYTNTKSLLFISAHIVCSTHSLHRVVESRIGAI